MICIRFKPVALEKVIFDNVTTTLDKLIKEAPVADLETARNLEIWFEQRDENGDWHFWPEDDVSSKTEIRPPEEYIRFKRIVLVNTDNNSTTSDSVVDAVEFNDVGGTNILHKNFYITLILISF